ncbi:MAG: hypothetical protein ABUL60_13455 [Myxococcales bacterium]
MVAFRCGRELSRLVLAVLVCCGSARAQASSHAQLTCLLDSGDVLGADAVGSVEEPPWQGLASLRRGDENRARMELSTSQAGFLPNVTTSAVLRSELGFGSVTAGSTPQLRDLSSSLGIALRLAPGVQLALRAFPFDTDYLRLGYLHALDWGGTDAARGEAVFLQQAGAVPGLQLALSAGKVRLFSAVKWATLDDPLRGQRRLWGALSGGSAALGAAWRVDGGFGYFQRPSGAPFTRFTSFVEGASLRVVWHHGVAEPELSAEPFRPPQLGLDPSRFEETAADGWALALEGVALVERFRRFEQPSAGALEAAPAAALYGSARGHGLAVHGAISWRSLPFVLRNDARLGRGESLPPGAVERAEIAAWLGGSITLLPVFLVPSVELGLRLPAALETPSILPGFAQTFLAGGSTGLSALPLGAGRLPSVSARLGARFQASNSVALSLFGELTRDPNRARFEATPSGVTRSFVRPERLALVAAAQARF